MKSISCKVLMMSAVGLCLNVASAEIPEGGKPVLNNTQKNHGFYANKEIASYKMSLADNTPIFEVNTVEKSDIYYKVQLIFPTDTPIAKGDRLLIAFKARTLNSENGIGAFQVYFQKNSKNWEKSISVEARADKEWRTYYYPFKSQNAFKPEGAVLCFGFGLYSQKVEISEVKLLNYGRSLKLKDLPVNNLPVSFYAYKGMGMDAPWRKQASERIDKIRKADIQVKVSQDGKEVKDAVVTVKMKRHAFLFGSAIKMSLLTEDSKDAKIFREKFLELFNSGGPENALKWPAVAGDWGPGRAFPNTKKSLEWLKEHEIKTRGHVLVWPSWQHSAKSIRQYEKEPEKLRNAIDEHIKDITQKCQPYLYEWDVINEPFNNNDLMKVLGYNVMTDWFVTARKSLPDNKLYLNDFDILTKPHGDHYEFFNKTVKDLQAVKAPIDGLGLQSHFGSFLNPPEDVLKTLDDLAQHGLQLKVTEFDINSSHQELMANYTRDFLTAIFSHPAIHGFQMWGFWAGAHWRPNAAMYTQDWQEKPNLLAYKNLVFKDWWTDETGKTDDAGKFATRGFLGDYEIRVKFGDKEKTVKEKLGKSGINVNVEL